MQQSNSNSKLKILYSARSRRVGLAVLAAALLLGILSPMGGKRAFPGGVQALLAAPTKPVPAAVLSGLITFKSGPQNARFWTLTLKNTRAAAADNAQVDGLTLSQEAGAACTPVITASYPLSFGTIDEGSSASEIVTIDFTGCPDNARFITFFTFSANSGAVAGSRTLYNQFQ